MTTSISEWSRALGALAEEAGSPRAAAHAVVAHLEREPGCLFARCLLAENGEPVAVAATAGDPAHSSADVPHREHWFEASWGEDTTALRFGGPLPGDGLLAWDVVLDGRLPQEELDRFRVAALHLHLGVLRGSAASSDELARTTDVLLDTLHTGLDSARETVRQREATLRAEARALDKLHRVGSALSAELELERIVQLATDAATELTGAAFGAFFYNVVDSLGESYLLYVLSGVPREAFSRFPTPRKTKIFGPTFDGAGVVRLDDVTADERYGHNPPHHGMPQGHLPVRSYLAVPVVSPGGEEVLGGFFFGHPDPGVFGERAEQQAVAVAAQAAVALVNARLYERQREAAAHLQRTLLPSIPEVDGLRIVSRYLPAARGVEVGGDWIDVIPLEPGRTALVVGDVMGKGVGAAAVMGQLRTAVRAYAITGLDPAALMTRMEHLIAQIAPSQIVTCVFAVLDLSARTLCWANAGHLPPALLSAGEEATYLDDKLGPPLGAGGTVFRERSVPLPEDGGLLLFTDGLVERRGVPLDDGLAALRERLTDTGQASPEVWSALIDDLTCAQDHDDDIAVLHVGFGR
ncbi:PP2C family protein-serine/threonine phosphatase [Umezawaea beigongshangensis]|uniref:PP2C family protein-serine/threonine phosphatase n=1 Tax=Umezawaea beigongshangensis TaxID=2780383 RepID=UPI0018F11405|nr:GAF domain-containing SpoIIE family protein phosphatase [Umezawaea beigongshangensis]